MPAMAAGELTSSSEQPKHLLSHFMSIRLLLLRPASRRSTQENEMIEILKSSYKAYSSGNRRNGADLAVLLAKDWVCLKSSFSGSTSTTPAMESISLPVSFSAKNPSAVAPPPSHLLPPGETPVGGAARRTSIPSLLPSLSLRPHSKKLAKSASVPNLGQLNALYLSVQSQNRICFRQARPPLEELLEELVYRRSFPACLFDHIQRNWPTQLLCPV